MNELSPVREQQSKGMFGLQNPAASGGLLSEQQILPGSSPRANRPFSASIGA